MHPATARLLATLGLAIVPCLAQAPNAKADAPPGFAEALARFKEVKTRLPFRFHTDGRQRLAETRSLAALDLLAEDYAKSKAHPEYTRYSLAALIDDHFDQAEFVRPLADLRAANSKPVDTWLWVNTLRIEADHGGDAAVIALAQNGANARQRAAAIAAIGRSRSGSVEAVIVPTCVSFPPKTKAAERMLLLGAMSGALLDNKARVNDARYREALKAYIGLLATDVDLTHTAEVQIARHLQWILGGPAPFVDPEPWLELLERGEVKPPRPSHTVVAPRFFGVETDGERLCYVVDMSDSMCKEIAPGSRPQTGPVTGPKVKKKRELMDESDLPWHRIRTRWDLAREQLRISLLRLTPDKYFSVVWFGSESGVLDSCKGMVKATRANVDRALAELDSIVTIPRAELPPDEQAVSPDGKLRGKTNLHSGLRRAYGLAGRGYVDEVAYVDNEALTEGCDTIFLLSDGAPSWDDFHVVDKDYGEGRVVRDTEYNAEAQRTPQIHYHGPYDDEQWLLEDLRRMNAFRRIRLHCVGLGEANMGLLQRLAAMGHGELFVFGDRKDRGAQAHDGAKK